MAINNISIWTKTMVDPIGGGTFSQLLNTINRNRSGLQNSLERISSGRRLNQAGTDAAASALSAQLRSEISSLTQAVSNVETGANFTRTADGGLAGVSDLVSRGRELAIQSSNGTLNDSQRQALSQELTQIQNEIDRLTGSLEFNGQKLLDGSLAPSADPVNIQAGSGSGTANQINLNVVESVTTESLGIDNSDISTSQGALQAVDDFERAAQTLNAARGQVGAVGNRLASAANGLNSQIENLTQAESGLADTDLAEEVTRLQQGLLRFETSIRALASQIQNEQSRARILDFSV
jgi:flagellin